MKNNILNHIFTALIMVSVTVFAACSVDVDLCDSSVHPHEGRVRYRYDWGDYRNQYMANGVPGKLLPDSMYIMATRVVNHYKTAMVVGSNSTGGGNRGYFVFNPPAYKPISTTPDPDNQPAEGGDDEQGGETGNGDNPAGGQDTLEGTREGDTNEEPVVMDAIHRIGAEMDEYPIRTGAYKFVTFNMDTTKFQYRNVVDYMMDPTSEKKLQQVYVEYKTYNKGDKGLNYDGMDDWQDYNPYQNYIQPNVTPIFIDTIAAMDITKEKVVLVYHPEPMTQNIDIYFNIKKNKGKYPFVIDDVRAEISGIPTRIYFANGNMDIRETAKMMFRTKLCDVATGEPINGTGKDDAESRVVRCHGNIDVTSVVAGSDSNISTGPGILQVIIYAHAETGEANPPRKKIQGKINLYKTLQNSKLFSYTKDGNFAIRNSTKGVIDVVADITINGEDIVLDSDNTGGVDPWIPCVSVDGGK